MTWFTEDSTPALVLGLITAAALLVAFIKTSRLGLLYTIGGVAIVTGAIVWIEKHTVTDTKRIRATLDEATAALERNDVGGVLNLISPSAKEIRQQVSSMMPQFEVHSASISGLAIKINRFNNPPTATAEFQGRVDGRERRGNLLADQPVFATVKLTLVLQNDRWLIDKYEWQLGIRQGPTP